MGRNKKIEIKHTENFPLLIKHIELMLKRQQLLTRLHGDDEYGVDRAISNGKANVLSLILDLANAYFEGEKWPNEMRGVLEIKLDGRYYYEKKGERNDATKTS